MANGNDGAQDNVDLNMDTDLAECLLALPTREQQVAALHAVQSFSADGLARVLDEAERKVGDDPGQARTLAQLCADLARDIGAHAIVPRATYLLAQTHAINVEFDIALDLIEKARLGYADAGMSVEAQRTHVGRMNVLQELDRYEEAIQTGLALIASLTHTDEPDERSLAAKVHHNLAICFEKMGRYDDALAAYKIAESHYRALNLTERLGSMSNDRGITLLGMSRSQAALQAFQDAAHCFAQEGLTLRHAQALLNMADAQLQLSHYTTALSVFARVRQILAPLAASAAEHELLLDMADAYLALSLYPEALATYRITNAQLLQTGMWHDRARALWGMGVALMALEQLDEAEPTFAASAAIFAESGNVPMHCEVRLKQAALQAALGQHTAGLNTARDALASVSRGNWWVQQARAHLTLADLLMPDAASALVHLQSAQRINERLNLPDLRLQLGQRLGRTQLALGRLAEAEATLLIAIREIEQQRHSLSNERMRTSFLHERYLPYRDLTQLYLLRRKPDDVQRAFDIAERGKSRALTEMLQGALQPHAHTDNAPHLDAPHSIRSRALHKKLNAIYSEMLQPVEEDAHSAASALEQRQAQAIALEQEISRLQLEAPEAVATPDAWAAPLGVDDIRQHLPADTGMVYYTVTNHANFADSITAFVITRDDTQVVRNLCTMPEVKTLLQQLELQWDRFGQDTRFIARQMPLMIRSTQAVLHALHQAVFEPIVSVLGTHVQRLVVVPHGVLHQVPFHALFDGVRYVLDEYEVTYAPSATAFALGQQRSAQTARTALVMGVSDVHIPAAEQEAQVVAQQLGQADLYVGTNATMTAFQAAAHRHSIIHLACHGMFRADNPLFSALKLHDGWLLAADIAQLDLRDALVTLSACESGRGTVLGGDEVIGLPRAFLGAGAATVVVSLWLAHDAATAHLMSDWYRQLDTAPNRAAALRAAQLALREVYPHPFYWASFVLIGKGL